MTPRGRAVGAFARADRHLSQAQGALSDLLTPEMRGTHAYAVASRAFDSIEEERRGLANVYHGRAARSPTRTGARSRKAQRAGTRKTQRGRTRAR